MKLPATAENNVITKHEWKNCSSAENKSILEEVESWKNSTKVIDFKDLENLSKNDDVQRAGETKFKGIDVPDEIISNSEIMNLKAFNFNFDF